MLEYKGYHAEIEFDEETNYYCGWLYGISDLVTFGGETEEEVEKDFYDAVDDYLEFCKETNQEPKREKNNLNLMVDYKILENLKIAAKNSGESLNEFVEKILSNYFTKTA